MKSRLIPAVALVLVTSLFSAHADAQSSSCGEPTSDSNGWAPSQPVVVNINTTNMTQDQIDAIEDALDAWSGSGGVTLSYHTSGDFDSNSNYNIRAGSINAYGVTSPVYSNSGDHITSATTTINQGETDYDSAFKTATHEIGHTFGLADGTYGDNSGSTAMATGNCGPEAPPNGACGTEGPTSDDLDAATCHDGYTTSVCGTPGDTHNPNCLQSCQASEDCPGGTGCLNGQCGCTDVCDDPSCPGYSSDACNDNGGGCGDAVRAGGPHTEDCGGCSDVCDPDCSNYNYCACYPDDYSQCGGCDPDGDDCDPESCNYNEFLCECGDVVRQSADADPNDIPAAKPRIGPRPDCRLEFPLIPFVMVYPDSLLV